MSPSRARALTAGILYFTTHVTSVAAVAAYGSALSDPAFVTGTSPDTLVRVGILLEVLLALGCLGTGVVLLPLLRPHGAALAYGFTGLRILEAAVIGAGAMAMIALVTVRQGWAGAAPDSAQPIGETLVALHAGSFMVGQSLIISVNTLVIAWLLLRSRLVFRGIAVLGLIGGVTVLTSNLAQLFGLIEAGGALAGLFAVPVFAFEIWFAGYLVFRGLRAVPSPAEPAATVNA